MSAGTAHRVHVFLDGIGWSSDRAVPVEQLTKVTHARDLPPLSANVLITFFSADSPGDLEMLRDVLEEMGEDCEWLPEEF